MAQSVKLSQKMKTEKAEKQWLFWKMMTIYFWKFAYFKTYEENLVTHDMLEEEKMMMMGSKSILHGWVIDSLVVKERKRSLTPTAEDILYPA